MSVILSIEGITIGNVTTDSNGNFTFNWQVPNIFEDGEHVVDAIVLHKDGIVQAKAMQRSSLHTELE